MKPKVCFLGTVYNGAPYLAETIESILCQTLKEIEVIYVNDGSTDSSAEILDYYSKRDDRFKFYSFKRNKGIAAAWNYGVQKVGASIICICSADDIYTPERAEWSYERLTGTGRDVFYGAFFRCDSLLRPLGGKLSSGEEAKFKPAIPFKKGELFKPNNQYIGHGFMAITTKMAKKVPYRKDLKVGIDYPFLKDLEKAGAKFCWTKESLGIYRFHPNMVSTTRRKEVEEANNA
jgi:glycosyltransferase involved in cell wall biosynthesis